MSEPESPVLKRLAGMNTDGLDPAARGRMPAPRRKPRTTLPASAAETAKPAAPPDTAASAESTALSVSAEQVGAADTRTVPHREAVRSAAPAPTGATAQESDRLDPGSNIGSEVVGSEVAGPGYATTAETSSAQLARVGNGDSAGANTRTAPQERAVPIRGSGTPSGLETAQPETAQRETGGTAPRSERKPAGHRNKKTVYVYVDQTEIITELSRMRNLSKTTTIALAFRRHLDTVAEAGPMLKAIKRPSGPLPEEQLVQLSFDAPNEILPQLERVAKKVANGNISAVTRAVIDAEAAACGLTIGPRPEFKTLDDLLAELEANS